MWWLLAEPVLRGLFVAVLVLAALQTVDGHAAWRTTVCISSGLLVGLGVAAWRERRTAHGMRSAAFLASMPLSCPYPIYAGVLSGLALAAYLDGVQRHLDWLFVALVGGAALGLGCVALRRMRDPWTRFGLGLVVGATLVVVCLWAPAIPSFENGAPTPGLLAAQLLLGLPAFYLLSFIGRTDEGEGEAGILGAGLALLLWLLPGNQDRAPWLVFLALVVLYFVYVRRVLPVVRAWKHVLRGASFARAGRYRPALESFRRALELRPSSEPARKGFWEIHRTIDVQHVERDPGTRALLDFDLCLERASSILLSSAPDEQMLAEAWHLLDLAEEHGPNRTPAIAYWRAVAHTHARRYDEAGASLRRILKPPATDNGTPAAVLLSAWQLALTLHSELNRRVGIPLLAVPGKRMEAIAVVERRLTQSPDDPGAWDLKRLLYSTLNESDVMATPEGGFPDFDHAYVQQLGLALIEDAGRWQRGAEYLRLAAGGLTEQRPSIFQTVAEAYRRAGDVNGASRHYEWARSAGLDIGLKKLVDAERQAFFAAVKHIADDARDRGALDSAITNYRMLIESDRSGLETLRTLASLCEQKGDAVGTLRAVEQALVYSPRDHGLLELKERCYYSLEPTELPRQLPALGAAFDIDYCLRTARTLMDRRDVDIDVLDWAEHLIKLVRAAQPESLAAQLLLARAFRRRGDRQRALQLLEDVFHGKPERFVGEMDEEAWFQSCRLLGETYLSEQGRPDLAIGCLAEFRKCSRSGADTLYKLGKAYEQVGDRKRAVKCYDSVLAYTGHPLVFEAHEALARLRPE